MEIVLFFLVRVSPMNKIQMKRPDASVLIKKLESGEISREEFGLFLEGLEDAGLAKAYDQGFRELFDRFIEKGERTNQFGATPENNQTT